MNANRYVALLSFLLISISQTHAGHSGAADKSIHGTWIVQSVVDRGKMVPLEKIKGIKFVFTDAKMTMVVPDKDKTESRVKVDFSTNPRTIDVIPSHGPHKDRTIPGI